MNRLLKVIAQRHRASAGAPVISGTPQWGQTLTSTVAGQWAVNGVAVAGATGLTWVAVNVVPGDLITCAGSNALTVVPLSLTSSSLSGSALRVLSGYSDNQFYDDGSPFLASHSKHYIEVSGGTGLAAGPYRLSNLTSVFGHGTYTLQGPNASTTIVAAGTSGCSWTLHIGGASTLGIAGTNFSPFYNNYWYDPDSQFKQAAIGAVIKITGGIGFTNGSLYTISDWIGNVVGLDCVTLFANKGYTMPSLSTCRNGRWDIVELPGPYFASESAPVQTSYTGSVKLLFVGDSITIAQFYQMTAELLRVFPNASSRVNTNKGVAGSTLQQWQPGQTYYNSAVTSANAAGSTVCSIMLGTNNSGVGSGGAAALIPLYQTLVDGLFADIPTLTKIILQYVTSPSGAAFTTTLNANLPSVGHGVIMGNLDAYNIFAANHQLFDPDLIHPNAIGKYVLAKSWLKQLVPHL